jgi:hypothetical protein
MYIGTLRTARRQATIYRDVYFRLRFAKEVPSMPKAPGTFHFGRGGDGGASSQVPPSVVDPWK